MPSSSGPTTLVFKYCLVGAPCGGASLGMVAAVSGCKEAALEDASLPLVRRLGVPNLPGIGLGAWPFVKFCGTAGD